MLRYDKDVELFAAVDVLYGLNRHTGIYSKKFLRVHSS
jgi:hypothetical protein